MPLDRCHHLCPAAIEEANVAVTAVNKRHSSSDTCVSTNPTLFINRLHDALMLDTLFDTHARLAVHGK